MTDPLKEGMPKDTALQRAIVHDLAACGHFLHCHAGGRGGKSPVLALIYLNGGSMTQREIIERFALKSGSLSEVITKLESTGLVERTRDDADRRQVIVTLTDTGREHAIEHIKTRHRFEQTAFSCLDDGEQEQLLNLLDRVVDHWKEL